MRKIFQKWLFIYIFAAFTLTFGLAWWNQTRQAINNADDLIGLKINDTKAQLLLNARHTQALRSLTDSAALAKAFFLAEMLRLEPATIDQPAKLERIRRRLDVDALHICDDRGIIVASTEAAVLNYDMNSTEQSKAFLPAITDPGFALVQDPVARGADGAPYQYAGVGRLDRPGIVQIGYYPQRLRAALAPAGEEALSGGLRIGAGGSVLVFKNGRVVSSANPAWMDKTYADFGLTEPQGDLSFRLHGPSGYFLARTSLAEPHAIVGLLPEAEVYAARNSYAVYILIGNLALFAVIFLLVSHLVDRVVIRGLTEVNASLAKITAGDLDEKLAVAGSPEFQALSEGLNAMVASLRQAADEAQKRIDQELALAKAIQLGSLPNVLTTSPYHRQFDIFASMFTAREVGGDFYDFFIIDQDHLGFLIADVSDKGIPAALFMMTAKAHLKNHLLTDKDLGAAITAVNKILCQDNQADMFVTCFAAVLRFSDGRLECVNAGHNPPLLAEGPGQNYSPLTVKRHFVLGGLDSINYVHSALTLSPGARLFLYTDGITEAVDPAGELYGEDRLLAFINHDHIRSLSPKKMISAVKEEVDAFMNQAEQADDITMLAMEYAPSRQ